MGNKQLLMRRHTEWVNLWNANRDSRLPKTKLELLRELSEWDKTQGGSSAITFNVHNRFNGIMEKDFDRDAWSSNHGDEFQRLVSQARKKREAPNADKGPENKPDNEQSTRSSVQSTTNLSELALLSAVILSDGEQCIPEDGDNRIGPKQS